MSVDYTMPRSDDFRAGSRERSLRENADWLAAQRNAFQAAMNGAPLATSLGILIRSVVEQSDGCPRGAFYINDGKGGLHHICGMPESYAHKVDGFAISPESLACGLAVAKGEPVITPDVLEEPRWERWRWLAQEYDYRGCWSFPIETATGKLVGSFALYFSEPRDPTPHDSERAAKLTQTAAILISYHHESVERARAEGAVRTSEEKYRSLFESIDSGYCIIEVIFDQMGTAIDYRFIEVNPAFEKQTNLVGALGRTVRSMVPLHEEFWFETFGRIARTGQPERFEHRADALDKWYSVYAFRIGEPDQHHVAVLFDDIKKRKLPETRTALLDRIGKILARLTSPDEITQAVGPEVGEFLGASGFVFCEVDAEGYEAIANHSWTTAHVPSLKQTYRLREYVTAEFTRACRAGENFVVNDTSQDARVNRESCARLKVGAFVVIPVLREGRWTAYLAATSVDRHNWAHDEVELLKEISERLFARIERANAESTLRESDERQTFLLKLSDALRRLADSAEIQETASRLLGEHLKVDRVVYADVEYDSNSSDAVIHGQFTAPGVACMPSRIPLGAYRDKFIHASYLGSLPVVVEDVTSDSRFTAEVRAKWLDVSLHAVIAVALLKNGRESALFGVHHLQPRNWSDGDVALVCDVAERAWAAAERARAESRVRESEERFQQFADASSGALWVRDAATLAMEYASSAITKVYGVQPNAFLGDVKHWVAAVLPEDRETALRHIEQARHGESVVHEFRIQRPHDNAFRWIRNTDFPLLDARGRIERIGGIAEDVTEAKLAIEHQGVLLAELQHRVRNVLAIIRSITERTGARAESVSEYSGLMSGRLLALARVQTLLTRDRNAIGIRTIVHDELSVQAHNETQYDLEGPDVSLSAKAAEILTLAVHELSTNALKYGALSVAKGKVTVRWRTYEKRDRTWLALDWTEEGAPAIPQSKASDPRRRGLGTELIEGRIPYELGGCAHLTIEPGGARCHIEFALADGPSILETGAPARATVFGGELDMTGEPALRGYRVLVVEDEYFLATDTARALHGAGADVVGPCATEESARSEIKRQRPDVVVLDINLGSGPSFKLAELLKDEGVPFVFVTGYDLKVIPEEFSDIERLQKPIQLRRIVGALSKLLMA